LVPTQYYVHIGNLMILYQVLRCLGKLTINEKKIAENEKFIGANNKILNGRQILNLHSSKNRWYSRYTNISTKLIFLILFIVINY